MDRSINKEQTLQWSNLIWCGRGGKIVGKLEQHTIARRDMHKALLNTV